MRLPVIALLGLVTFSCDRRDLPGQNPDGGPSIGIAFPDDEASIFSSSVWVEVKASNFTPSPSLGFG